MTQQEFNDLKVGDYLKTENSTLLVEAKFANTIAVIDDQDDAYVYSFKEVRQANYSINQPIQHNCGFPYGDYSDREVIVKISNASIEICEIRRIYTRLITVNEEGFRDNCGELFKFAVLASNNVDLVK
jgi:hypothetical protein